MRCGERCVGAKSIKICPIEAWILFDESSGQAEAGKRRAKVHAHCRRARVLSVRSMRPPLNVHGQQISPEQHAQRRRNSIWPAPTPSPRITDRSRAEARREHSAAQKGVR